MKFKSGDKVKFFPATHPNVPREATFIKICGIGAKAKIELTEPDGKIKTVFCGINSLEYPNNTAQNSTVFIDSLGFKR